MRYPIVVFVFLGLFLVASIIQLILAFTENQRLRRKEKFLCMLFLGIAAIFAFPNEPLIYVGAFLGMLGDILVLRKKTFIAGTVSFFFGHVCFIVETLWRIIGFSNIRWFLYVVFALCYAVSFFVVYSITKKNHLHSKVDKLGTAWYFSILVVYLPVFTLAAKVSNWMIFSLVGSVIFLISDTILVKTHFGRKFKRYDFYIMLTYLLAELLIISGFVLTLIFK